MRARGLEGRIGHRIVKLSLKIPTFNRSSDKIVNYTIVNEAYNQVG
jgi:hypothetical protein